MSPKAIRWAGPAALHLLLLLLLPGCSAPGQRKATSQTELLQTFEKLPAASASWDAPVVIEVSVGNIPTPFLWLEQEGKMERYHRASVHANAALMKKRYDQLKPWMQTNLWNSALLEAEAGLASDRLQAMSELYHGIELVQALRDELPGARVVLALRDPDQLKAFARNFDSLQEPQGITLNLPPAPYGAYPWNPPAIFGVVHSPPTPSSPAGLVVELDLRRAKDANQALDQGGTFGRMVNIQAIARLGDEISPAFISGDNEKRIVWQNHIEAIPTPSSKIKDNRLGHDPEWLAYWFGKVPSETEWKAYQKTIRTRSLLYHKELVRLHRATLYEIDKDLLATNLSSVVESPFLWIHSGMVRKMAAALPKAGMLQAQAQQLQQWARNFDPSVNVDETLLDKERFPQGSKQRSLASFLHAELQMRERLTDLLIGEQYLGELGALVRSTKEEEERVASKIKTLRNTATAIAIVGSLAGAGMASMGALQAGNNLSAAQATQSQVNTMNTTTLTAAMSVLGAASDLNLRSLEMASNLSAKIGPIQIEIAGQVQSIQAGSVSELRAAMKDLYARHHGAPN